MADSGYYNTSKIAKIVAEGKHREAVGGRWEEIGLLQFEFLKAQGLRPSHKLIDIGCGSLRGGVHFIDYLEANGYYGLDINQNLLDAGWEKELMPRNLHPKIDRSHLVAAADFQFDRFDTKFDYAISISLFTHLTFNSIRRCLLKSRSCLKDGARYYSTFFLVDDAGLLEQPQEQGDGHISYSHKDPYHYSSRDVQRLAEDSGFGLEIIGDWNHPRNQKMVCFTK